MPDNFESARTYWAFFAGKQVLIRVGRDDTATPGTQETESLKGEATMWYMAHALIREGFQIENIDDLQLVAFETKRPVFKSEILLLKATLVEALTHNLK